MANNLDDSEGVRTSAKSLDYVSNLVRLAFVPSETVFMNRIAAIFALYNLYYTSIASTWAVSMVILASEWEKL